jgi:hypothetical protein
VTKLGTAHAAAVASLLGAVAATGLQPELQR